MQMAADYADCARQRDEHARARTALQAQVEQLTARCAELERQCSAGEAEAQHLQQELAQTQASLGQAKVRWHCGTAGGKPDSLL